MATTSISNETINIEREKANLLTLIKLTLNTLIDQSCSMHQLDDGNPDVMNFMITLERILSFRMRANWLSERRYFWDFIKPACIGSCRQNIIERVEDLSKMKSLKEKGRAWIKFALLEKKLSELLKLVISDCHLVRKFYHDDSIMTSSQAFILCDQLTGLSAIDFSFCFKQPLPTSLTSPISSNLNDLDIDVIDVTPFLCYKSKHAKYPLQETNVYYEEQNVENKSVDDVQEMTELNLTKAVSIEKYKLEVEQRKYFEELLSHRDRELQQIKIQFENLKRDRETEVMQMENIIVELQLELHSARDDAERKRKKQPVGNISSNRTEKKKPLFPLGVIRRSSTSSSLQPITDIILTNDDDNSSEAHMRSIENSLTQTDEKTVQESNVVDQNLVDNLTSKVNEYVFTQNVDDNSTTNSQSSRRSSHSTNGVDEQYELVQMGIPTMAKSAVTTIENQNENALISSAEMLSSVTSLSGDDETEDKQQEQDTNKIIDESGSFETTTLSPEQQNLLQEENTE
ncbi:unnamed protein product [Didymodactylos carnosus]|uniref:RUN domain-containing protein n=1 Tax=Didymodactylos carnosus TaxID=1234261 RepID=A0A813RUT1_9BILA|nr:unnamed protein product [Didymodactylos carnosus]CAF0786112.1 unnamed protein product [Didymodactylos carnosus]CAF3505229.1 unnamed protein product [Didymodactylos carnosus]CAF3569867.1 unnamed protein product [Didymodactylos carnosus]